MRAIHLPDETDAAILALLQERANLATFAQGRARTPDAVAYWTREAEARGALLSAYIAAHDPS